MPFHGAESIVLLGMVINTADCRGSFKLPKDMLRPISASVWNFVLLMSMIKLKWRESFMLGTSTGFRIVSCDKKCSWIGSKLIEWIKQNHGPEGVPNHFHRLQVACSILCGICGNSSNEHSTFAKIGGYAVPCGIKPTFHFAVLCSIVQYWS